LNVSPKLVPLSAYADSGFLAYLGLRDEPLTPGRSARTFI